jgi:ABC-type amino acid transport substrate-binding protein
MSISHVARLACCLLLLDISCDLPRDAEGTLHRVTGGVLRIGVAENPPWVEHTKTNVDGIDVRLANALARELGAQPVWRAGSESTLLAALAERKLDLVIGGLTSSSPWTARVALTHPYEGGPSPTHVMATALGENAWLVHVDHFLANHGPAAAGHTP